MSRVTPMYLIGCLLLGVVAALAPGFIGVGSNWAAMPFEWLGYSPELAWTLSKLLFGLLVTCTIIFMIVGFGRPDITVNILRSKDHPGGYSIDEK